MFNIFSSQEDKKKLAEALTKVDSLEKDMEELQNDIVSLKVGLTELQISLGIILSATQAMAEDLAHLYDALKLKRIDSHFMMPRFSDDDDDLPN